MRQAFRVATNPICVAAALTAVCLAGPELGPVRAQTAPPARVVKIVGDGHALLLRADGSVAGWGRFRDGQLGPVAGITATRMASAHLVPIELPAPAVDVATGGASSYAVLDDGTVMAWGKAEQGQLGIGPVKPPLLAGSTSSMEYRGIETPTRVVGISDAVAVAAAGPSAYAVLKDGTVRAWGGVHIGDDRAPKSFGGQASAKGPAYLPVPVPGLTEVVAVSAGSGHVLALTRDGRVYSWGSNTHGALGRGPRQELPIDTAGEVPGLSEVVRVVAGAGVSTALKKDGTVWVWGANMNSQFGFGPRTNPPGPTSGWVLEPQQVPGVAKVTAIALGVMGRHTLALLEDGTLRAWGNTDWGQAGSGAGPGFHERPLTPKIAGVQAVFAAGNNSYAVRADGSLWVWGAGGPGEFPLTSNVRVPAPGPPGLR